MRIACIHCQKKFRISAEQLGGTGACPHCGGQIQLPAAADLSPGETTGGRFHWLTNSLSGLISICIHVLLALLLALFSYESFRGEGLGEEVLIGTLPTEVLGTTQEDVLKSEPASAPQALDEALETEPPVDSSDPLLTADAAVAPSASGQSEAFDLGSVTIGGGSMSGGSWDGMLQSLRRNGLDIVITFDSTGSMSGEINQVKQQVARIGKTLIELVPKARIISICTYRDQDDQYLVRGTPLSNDLREVQYFLDSVSAGGGGDHPEAVHEGLRWAIENNDFRPRTRKVILLFGDAPPHTRHRRTCLQLASDFHSQQDGVVSTVTCRANRRMAQFQEIAEVGGGEAFLTSDERQIVTQLMVLVFGSRHRDKVLEAFKVLESR